MSERFGMLEQDLNFANAVQDGWTGGVEIFLADKQPGRLAVVSGFQMTVYSEGEAPKPMPIKLTRGAASRLMNALWAAGLRPTNELESIGQKEALQAHLADMRKLAFHTLGVEKP
ncbi:MAG: hypothetical protein KGL39_34915 [Patescibacteria group bacterium]|nr:hypothetical protein [Patescibacteria group bacterium]